MIILPNWDLSYSGSDLGGLHEGFLGRRVVEDEHHHLRCKGERETVRHALLHSALDVGVGLPCGPFPNGGTDAPP